MRFKESLIELIVGILGLISFSSIYMGNPTFSYYIPLIFCFLIVILTSVFELFSYFNKNFYQLTVILILILMWIIGHIWLSPEADKIIYYVITGLITIIAVVVIIFVPKEWEKIR